MRQNLRVVWDGFYYQVSQRTGACLVQQQVQSSESLPGTERAANRQLWYDPTASRRTHCNFPGAQNLCRYGSAGNYFLIMPGVKRIEMTLRNNWEIPKMGEQAKLRFRAEFYNALDTPGFGAPNNIGCRVCA